MNVRLFVGWLVPLLAVSALAGQGEDGFRFTQVDQARNVAIELFDNIIYVPVHINDLSCRSRRFPLPVMKPRSVSLEVLLWAGLCTDEALAAG